MWSGACQFKNQNSCDFRAWNVNGTDVLSTIMYRYKNDTTGHGVIMDSSYTPIKHLMAPPEMLGWNMHEMGLVNQGTAVVYFTMREEYVNVTMVPGHEMPYGWIMNMGIREVDLKTGENLFEWWAHPEVSLTESNVAVSSLHGPYPNAWNWFHGNSIVKNAEGDYLVNSRYTDAVYKISGKTRKIIWRLGGRKSDFKMDGFNFSRQHDARWIEDECDEKTEMITLLDNASDSITSTSNTSSAIQIRLDKDSMTATLVKRWNRPDNGRSNLRGNFQHLPNGNVFAAWSDNGYISEHTSDGDLVMAAEFSSTRFVTYRAYKANFTGHPTEPPVTKAFVYGVDPESSTTVVYMSWNGATEVDSWDVHRASTGELLGTAQRIGFETRLQIRGYVEEVFVKAMDENGEVLGTTDRYKVEAPREWNEDDSGGWEYDFGEEAHEFFTADREHVDEKVLDEGDILVDQTVAREQADEVVLDGVDVLVDQANAREYEATKTEL